MKVIYLPVGETKQKPYKYASDWEKHTLSYIQQSTYDNVSCCCNITVYECCMCRVLHYYLLQLFKFDRAYTDQTILWQMKTSASYCTHIKITLIIPMCCLNKNCHQRPAPSYLHSCNRKSSMLYATDIRYTNFSRLRVSSIIFSIHCDKP